MFRLVYKAFFRLQLKRRYRYTIDNVLSPLNAELNLICHLLALLGVHYILHISRVRVNT